MTKNIQTCNLCIFLCVFPIFLSLCEEEKAFVFFCLFFELFTNQNFRKKFKKSKSSTTPLPDNYFLKLLIELRFIPHYSGVFQTYSNLHFEFGNKITIFTFCDLSFFQKVCGCGRVCVCHRFSLFQVWFMFLFFFRLPFSSVFFHFSVFLFFIFPFAKTCVQLSSCLFLSGFSCFLMVFFDSFPFFISTSPPFLILFLFVFPSFRSTSLASSKNRFSTRSVQHQTSFGPAFLSDFGLPFFFKLLALAQDS